MLQAPDGTRITAAEEADLKETVASTVDDSVGSELGMRRLRCLRDHGFALAVLPARTVAASRLERELDNAIRVDLTPLLRSAKSLRLLEIVYRITEVSASASLSAV